MELGLITSRAAGDSYNVVDRQRGMAASLILGLEMSLDIGFGFACSP
jgi:hypothetical protein